uniref:GCN5-related N-acetyltransferase n=1 Tax=Rhodopseudomonas palustris (strain BisA53) TaxID=316055 RepID=Q07KU8_RHOP5
MGKQGWFQVPRSIELTFDLLAERRYREVARGIAARVHRRGTSYGLRRDLTVPFAAPAAKIPLTVRPLRSEDVPILFEGDVSVREAAEMIARRKHLAAEIPQCYVAIDERDGTPCYFQWLMGPKQNAKIKALFGGDWFPVLAPDEALLENAYTPVRYRGNGIMPAAMAQIAEHAAEIGCRYVITFVASDNAASLHGCAKAGFKKYIAREETDTLGLFHSRRFVPLPEVNTAAATPTP